MYEYLPTGQKMNPACAKFRVGAAPWWAGCAKSTVCSPRSSTNRPRRCWWSRRGCWGLPRCARWRPGWSTPVIRMGPLRDEQRQCEDRELYYAVARDGMTVVEARLDRETGAKLRAALEPLAAPRPERDGRKDPRTAGQRHADALAAALEIALGSDGLPRAGGQRPHITDAEILPMVLGGDGQPWDVGRSQRTAPPHLRAALLARDGGCCFPGCDQPPRNPRRAPPQALGRRRRHLPGHHGDVVWTTSQDRPQPRLGHRPHQRTADVHPTIHSGPWRQPRPGNRPPHQLTHTPLTPTR
jgi:hypothetical protein